LYARDIFYLHGIVADLEQHKSTRSTANYELSRLRRQSLRHPRNERQVASIPRISNARPKHHRKPQNLLHSSGKEKKSWPHRR
jgi:hypothetical protein